MYGCERRGGAKKTICPRIFAVDAQSVRYTIAKEGGGYVIGLPRTPGSVGVVVAATAGILSLLAVVEEGAVGRAALFFQKNRVRCSTNAPARFLPASRFRGGQRRFVLLGDFSAKLVPLPLATSRFTLSERIPFLCSRSACPSCRVPFLRGFDAKSKRATFATHLVTYLRR